jgi:hypothetical protein
MKAKVRATKPLCSFCKLCVSAVQAHIIPQSFIRKYSDDGQPNFIMTNRDDCPRTTWTGLYDDALVCLQCERGFSEYDRYGYQFFHREQLTPVCGENGLIEGWEHPGADSVKLKLFALSILWRASASKRREFRSIDLGRWEIQVRDMIAQNDPGAVDRFPVVIERFDAAPGEAPTFYPYRTEIGGSPCLKFELAGCAIVTALQGRQWPLPLIEIALAPGRPVYLIEKNYKTSQERGRFMKIATAIYSKLGRLPGKRKK